MTAFNLLEALLKMPPAQDMVRMICVTVAQRAPEYGLGTLVLDLLQLDAGSAWDGVMIGLRALLAILLAAPAQALGTLRPGKPEQVRLAGQLLQSMSDQGLGTFLSGSVRPCAGLRVLLAGPAQALGSLSKPWQLSCSRMPLLLFEAASAVRLQAWIHANRA